MPVSEARRLFVDHASTTSTSSVTSQPASSSQPTNPPQLTQPLIFLAKSAGAETTMDDFGDLEFDIFPSDDDFDVLSPVKPKVQPPTVFQDDPFNPMEPPEKATVPPAISKPNGGKKTVVRSMAGTSQISRETAVTASELIDTDPLSGLRIL